MGPKGARKKIMLFLKKYLTYTSSNPGMNVKKATAEMFIPWHLKTYIKQLGKTVPKAFIAFHTADREH